MPSWRSSRAASGSSRSIHICRSSRHSWSIKRGRRSGRGSAPRGRAPCSAVNQARPDAGRPSHGGLLLYVGTTGTLYGQHPIAEADGLSSQRVVNDGLWHHVAIVRDGDRQALYVDGVLNDSVEGAIEARDPMECQAGIGYTTSWPHARLGWMGYRGDIDGLAVARRAWSPEDVRRDWGATRPRDDEDSRQSAAGSRQSQSTVRVDSRQSVGSR